MQNKPYCHVLPEIIDTKANVIKSFVDPTEDTNAENIYSRKPSIFRQEPLKWDSKWPALKSKNIGN